MNPRFDLPPEVMLGERVVKPAAPVKVPAKPVRVAPGILADAQGRLRTDLPLPVATLADRAMLDADLGDSPPAVKTDMPAIAQRQQDQARELAQLADQKSNAARLATSGPRFRVTRNGISTTLTAPELTDDEVYDLGGVFMESAEHSAALAIEVERMDTFIDINLGGELRQRVSLRQATDDQMTAYGKGPFNTRVFNAWHAERKRRGLCASPQVTTQPTAPSDAEVASYYKRAALGKVTDSERVAFAARLKLRRGL